MAKSFSFDITSKFDISELDHAIDQAKREIINRYDFKGTSASIEYLDEHKKALKLEAASDYQLDSIIDIIRAKLAKRGLSQKILLIKENRIQAGMLKRQEIPFVSGLDQEKAKKISKLVKDKLPKVKSQIIGEEVRISSSSKDELQKVMKLVNEANFDFPTNFENFR